MVVQDIVLTLNRSPDFVLFLSALSDFSSYLPLYICLEGVEVNV